MIVRNPRTFSIKHPRNQTKVNEVKFPGKLFFLSNRSQFPPLFSSTFDRLSVYLPSLQQLTSAFLFFSFNKYICKGMACIQPSFLRF